MTDEKDATKEKEESKSLTDKELELMRGRSTKPIEDRDKDSKNREPWSNPLVEVLK